MSKPLILVLQIAALWLLVQSVTGDAGLANPDWPRIGVAVALLIAAGVAFRKRVRR